MSTHANHSPLPAAASLPLPAGSAGATVRLHPLLCGTSLAPSGWTFRHEGRGAARRALGIGVQLMTAREATDALAATSGRPASASLQRKGTTQ